MILKETAIDIGLFFCRRFLKIFSSVLILLVFTATFAYCQSLDNKGKDFIFGFLPNLTTSNVVELHLASDVATNVTIDYPVNSPTFTTTVPVTPGTVTIVNIPNTAANNWPLGAVGNHAVRAYAAEEFVAYLINRRTASTDAALGLPIDTMNTEYLVMTYAGTSLGSHDRGEFVVVAGYDNTTVTITPTNILAGGFPAYVPFSVTLNRGEGFLGQSVSSGAAAADLTGTVISSDRPVGVTNGNKCANIPSNVAACDHIFEVAQPVQSWGDEIFAANLPNRPNGTIYRVLASEDATTVTQNGGVLGVLNRGQFIETPVVPGEHVFAADKPIYVDQFMVGDSYAGADRGDPAMGNMIPADQYLSEYTFSTVGGNQFVENFLTVVAQQADVTAGTIMLDGSTIPAASFTPIGGTGYLAAVVPLTDGTHSTTSVGVHGITVEGYNSFDSYIYPGGALFEFINPSGDENPPMCMVVPNAGPPPFYTGTAVDDRPSEDVNNNGVLDAGEDLNNNGVIDEDTGIFFVALEGGATNLDLVVEPFVPGDGSVNFTVGLSDTSLPGAGTVRVTDGAGNICQSEISLDDSGGEQGICDVDGDGDIDKRDLRKISRARRQPASGPDDPRDANGDGRITPRDVKVCIPQCTLPGCAVQ